ncbi:DUF5707 domain-containing protein [Streptomyces lomondensis]|uniref:Uncharacterized protein n=1 Tax=Streptomyces lomondensis TaxID=68229 RepID=A0ABQ2XLX8_9ACTN|nr:DUF5707 domain-containing protein [Streptomyces lomondensis]MCF0076492.1 DUF5707 domain-containing protein [Streptomyces lomondensis]GGX24132.1 hypothetical protein GCM10010383_63080 [Streptomyces lomondensis]
MSKRNVVSSLVAVAAIGGIAAGGIAVASASGTSEPALKNSSARFSGTGTGTLTFTTDVTDDSGVRGLKVLAWPASSKLDPTEAELRSVESATCESTGEETSRCTYTVRATKEEAAELGTGTWYVSALATAKDGDTTFVPRAATFEVTR